MVVRCLVKIGSRGQGKERGHWVVIRVLYLGWVGRSQHPCLDALGVSRTPRRAPSTLCANLRQCDESSTLYPLH